MLGEQTKDMLIAEKIHTKEGVGAIAFRKQKLQKKCLQRSRSNREAN